MRKRNGVSVILIVLLAFCPWLQRVPKIRARPPTEGTIPLPRRCRHHYHSRR